MSHSSDFDVPDLSWRSRTAFVAGVWIAGVAGASFFGLRVQPLLGLLVLLAVCATVWLFTDASARSTPTGWRTVDDDPVREPGQDPRLALLHRVVTGHLDARGLDEQLPRHLLALADQRLLAHHGVDRRTDPGHAAELMGPELTALADRPTRLDLPRITHLVDRIESL